MSGRGITRSPSGEIQRVPLLFTAPEQESLDSPIDRRSDYYRQQARQKKRVIQQPQPLMTLPNILTFFRIVLIPVLCVLWFQPHQLAPIACAVVFITAAVTDWADGYLARKLKITSAFGAFLDPVADKIMVSTALILLAATPPEPLSHKDMAAPVVIIIGREITMSALREWAALSGSGAHKAVKVNSLGKWKTALQMVGMSAMMTFRRAEYLLGNHDEMVRLIQLGTRMSLVIIWAGTFLAVWSLSNYMANVWAYFRYPDGLPEGHPAATKPPLPVPPKKTP
ncbi:hypothetical protein WJX72_000337 [[Myrmecia] bisecta]|uniref:CDP-diacylglycerol--glycerol-3-phosphate 3-phosphatidyltransferase n=1 Tax=[Myrmecia] bisecta TaxID=41462 RepID=A0AAW1P8S3_9CHLO